MTIENRGDLNVSRETIRRLEEFQELVKKWTPKINLVSRNSVKDLWERHIVDSLQLVHLAGDFETWVDLGSGGGFPALVVSIATMDAKPERYMTLIESDKRKCAFLSTVIRDLSLPAKVMNCRIEDAPPVNADVVSARALANLSKLLEYASIHLAEDGVAIFPKGATWQKEVEDAKQRWSFDFEEFTSWTDQRAAILRIRRINRV